MGRHQKEYELFVEGYFLSKSFEVTEPDGKTYIKYNSGGGMISINNIRLMDLCEGGDYSAIEVKFYLTIITRIKPSKNIFESGVVKLVGIEWEHMMNRRTFRKAVNNLVSGGYLVRTPIAKIFIIPPRIVCKIYRSEIEY